MVTAATRMVYGKQEAVPGLENGDHLTQVEFHRRYAALGEEIKAELVEGIVHMPSPTRMNHARAHAAIIGRLSFYSAYTSGTELADNATVILDGDNEVQPDGLLRKVKGGSSRVNDEDYVVGPPELIVEIASSGVAYDLYEKRNAYRRNGVQEYKVWTLHENAIHWFRLHEGRYVQVEPDDTGVIRSQVFPGLWLNVPALLRHDLPTVLATVQAGMDAQQRSGPGGPGAVAASTEAAPE